MIPALLARPQRGDLILDMCAAPGNKTAQLAAAVGDAGGVVANDVSSSRLHILRGTVDRLGLANVSVTNYDAQHFPDVDNTFDAVLADVPCSCEGTSRKYSNVLRPQHPERRSELGHTQESILRAAIRLTRPGGRIVYSTCTYAPEENEAILDRVITQPEEEQQVRLEPIDLPKFRTSPGLNSWQGKRYDNSIRNSIRIWPHANDTGGFFVGVLEKLGQGTPPEQNIPSSAMTDLAQVDVESWPWSAFGLPPSALNGLASLETGGKYDRLCSTFAVPPALEYLSVGMISLNQKSEPARFSTALAQRMGVSAEAGIAEIGSDDVTSYFLRGLINIEDLKPPLGRTRLVIVRSGPMSLGLGFVSTANPAFVQSLFPKIWGGLNVQEWIGGMTAEK
jgi:SAM-dependent methyltransferase